MKGTHIFLRKAMHIGLRSSSVKKSQYFFTVTGQQINLLLTEISDEIIIIGPLQSVVNLGVG